MSAKASPNDKRISCAIEICPNRVAVAKIDLSPKTSRPIVQKCDFRLFKECVDLTDCEMMAKHAVALINKHNLQHQNFHCVLQPAFYRLLLVDAPSVPDHEYKAAIRWQIKDMIDFPLEDAVVDLFHPTPFLDMYKKKMYAVVARSSLLMKWYEFMRQNLINIVTFDIQELAIRNLTSLIEAYDAPVGILQISSEDIALIIIQKNDICFSRRMPISLSKLIHENRSTNVMLEEIQRSLNYYQAELKQEALHDLGMAIEFVDLNKLLDISTPLSNEQQAHCYMAIGGVLRDYI